MLSSSTKRGGEESPAPPGRTCRDGKRGTSPLSRFPKQSRMRSEVRRHKQACQGPAARSPSIPESMALLVFTVGTHEERQREGRRCRAVPAGWRPGAQARGAEARKLLE